MAWSWSIRPSPAPSATANVLHASSRAPGSALPTPSPPHQRKRTDYLYEERNFSGNSELVGSRLRRGLVPEGFARLPKIELVRRTVESRGTELQLLRHPHAKAGRKLVSPDPGSFHV